MTHFDAIVIGGGIVGSNTAKFLQEHGKRVLLLEQFSRGHSRGSSHGFSRITRAAYSQSHFATMMRLSNELWASLEKTTGSSFRRKAGLIYSAPMGSQEFEKYVTSLRSNNFPFELLSEAEVCKRFPQWRFPLDKSNPLQRSFLFDPSGASIRASHALNAVQDLFIRAGGQFQDESRVVAIDWQSAPIGVTLADGRRYTCDRAVLTPGTWASKLLRLVDLELPLVPLRTAGVYWRVRQANVSFAPDAFPTFIFYVTRGELEGRSAAEWRATDNELVGEIYGLPAAEYDGLAKVCWLGGPKCDPDARDAIGVEGEELDALQMRYLSNFVARYLPDLDSTAPAIVERCTFTMAPKENFVIDYHPKNPHLIIGSCCSGHGFKLAPQSGRMLGILALPEAERSAAECAMVDAVDGVRQHFTIEQCLHAEDHGTEQKT